MHPPIVPHIRQGFAQPSRRAAKVIATAASGGQSFPSAGRLSLGSRRRDCTPSPSTRPVPERGRSGLFRRSGDARRFADGIGGALAGCAFRFKPMLLAVELAATTTRRGIEPCVKILSFLHLRPRPFRAAWPPRPSAALAAPLRVLPLPTHWMKTWLRARPSAHSPARPLVVCRACRPAAATDLTAAFGQRVAPTIETITRPSGHAVPVAFVMSASRSGCGGRGERCSRRS